MSNPKRIPPPRYLFPEFAAWFIETQRGLLRVKWALREDQDWFPAWSIGSIAGICGVMLAILLFFLERPQVVAAPAPEPSVSVSRFVQEVPVVSEATVPETQSPRLSKVFGSPFPEMSLKTPQLTGSTLVRTELPYIWDQKETESLTSRPRRIQERFIKDDWTRTTPTFAVTSGFRPYLLQGATIPVTPSYVTTSGQRAEFDGILATRNQGIRIEKQMLPATSVGQPYTYLIQVSNRSNDAIDEVYVHERLSAIHRVSEVVPPAAVQGDELVWSLGKLAANVKKTLQVTLIPETSQQIKTETTLKNRSVIGGIASVSEPAPAPVPDLPEPSLLPVAPEEPVLPIFEEPAPKLEPAPAPVSEAPRPFPELKLSVAAVKVVKQGENLTLTFTVSNVGTAAAENIRLFVNLSGEFRHKYGDQVQHTISRLEPGQSRKALFQARAKEAGNGVLAASLQMEGNEEKSEELQIRIDPAPVAVSGRATEQSMIECQRPETTPVRDSEEIAQLDAVHAESSTLWKRFSE